VLSGTDFIRPFFLRQADHIEFAATTISLDLPRRDDGRPEIRSWTGDIVDALRPADKTARSNSR